MYILCAVPGDNRSPHEWEKINRKWPACGVSINALNLTVYVLSILSYINDWSYLGSISSDSAYHPLMFLQMFRNFHRQLVRDESVVQALNVEKNY